MDPSKQARIEEFMRKVVLGEDLVDTQFHLFSARFPSAGRVLKPRVLCANNVLLAKSSKYFLDLLSTDIHPSDPSLVDLVDDNDVPGSAPVDEYGYESDSDLDECNDSIQLICPEAQEDRPVSKNDNDDGARSIASSETAVQERAGDSSKELTMRNQTAMRLRSLASRHIFVKDTAFQTWYTLLNYLHTNKFNFLPLRSTMPSGHPRATSSTSSLDEPRCSAKSMYRLACKIGLNRVRDVAFVYIRNSLTEQNIIQELSCGLLSTHPELLEMELEVLYTHNTSPHVMAHFPELARRIANKELAHGAEIIVWLHTRLSNVSPSFTWPRSGSGPRQTAPLGFGLRNPESAVPTDGAERAGASAGDASKGEDGKQKMGVPCDPAPVPAPPGANAEPVPPFSFSSVKIPKFSFDPPPPNDLASNLAAVLDQPSQAKTSSSEGKKGVACDPPPAPRFAPPPSSTTSEAKAPDPASLFTSVWGQPSQAKTSSSEGKKGVARNTPPAPRFSPPPLSTASETKAPDPASLFTSVWGQPSQAKTSSSEGKKGVACDTPPAPRFSPPPLSTASETKAPDPASLFTSLWGQPPQAASSSEGKTSLFSFDRPPALGPTTASFFEKAGPSPLGEEPEAVPRAKFLVGKGPIKVNAPSPSPPAAPKPFSFGS